MSDKAFIKPDKLMDRNILPVESLWTLPGNTLTDIGRQLGWNAGNSRRSRFKRRIEILRSSNNEIELRSGSIFKKYASKYWRRLKPNSNKLHKEDNENHKFHRIVSTILITGQIFALLPVIGVTDKSPINLSFRWLSWRMFYIITSTIGVALQTGVNIHRLTAIGVSYRKSSRFAFCLTTLFTNLFFLRLAMHWPQLVQKITATEDSLSKTDRISNIGVKLKRIYFLILFLATVEHLLAIITDIQVAIQCKKDYMDAVESFFKNTYSQTFRVTSFSYWKGAAVMFLNVQSTFNWNFMDLFIIIMSCYIAEKFGDINLRLEGIHGKHVPEDLWRTIREDYVKLAQMARDIDEAINGIVLLSFANNLYFICLQLFNSLNFGLGGSKGDQGGILGGYEHAIYFSFSFAFLFGRTLAVSLYAAQVSFVSKEPTITLYAVPAETYCTEVERFLQQVTYDDVALTGMRFFNVTRGLVLTVAGTIVTYELVLLQFTSKASNNDVECFE